MFKLEIADIVPMDLDNEAIKQKLAGLVSEHRDLDALIAHVADSAEDQLQIQRLKKRKLALKDMIARLESLLLPDIIA